MRDATIPYVCPQCKAALSEVPSAYRCRECQRQYPIVMGIPDFRLFPDPYISIEDDYRKAAALAESYHHLDFPLLVERYWEITPGLPQVLVRQYVRSALDSRERSLRTWRVIDAIDGPGGRNRLLDVGCGTAGFLAATGPVFARAVGLDIAFRWLIVARKRLEEAGLKNVDLVCGCAEHLPFPDGIFDLVVAEDALDHTRDQQAFMRESARVLKVHTGVFYLSTPNRYSLGPDPHVWVWGVGFLPPRLRDRYVRWRRGISYGPIRPVSYVQLRRLLRIVSFRQCRVILPELRGLDQLNLSPWQRTQARLYEFVRGMPWLRPALRFVAPGFQVLCRKADREIRDTA